MNSLERLGRRLRGEPVDRPPNLDILMTRAAHHVGRPLRSYYLDCQVLVEATLAVREAFDLDIVQTISDAYREAADMGLDVEFPEDGLPLRRRPLLVDPTELRRLRPVPPGEGRRMSDRIEAVRRLRDQVGDEVPVMGWVEGPLALAADLRGDAPLLLDLYDRPAWVWELLELLLEQQIAFARAQIEAGAHIIGLGDSIASLLSPKHYREFALPYEQRIFTFVKRQGSTARLHICGNTNRILAEMATSGADIVDLDWMVDLGAAAAVFADGPAPCGNFDPVRVMLQGTPQTVREAVRRCSAVGGPRLLSAAGCEIPDGTPDANLRAHTQALRDLPTGGGPG